MMIIAKKTPETGFLQTPVFNWKLVAARCFEKFYSRGFFHTSVKSSRNKIARCETLILRMMKLAVRQV